MRRRAHDHCTVRGARRIACNISYKGQLYRMHIQYNIRALALFAAPSGAQPAGRARREMAEPSESRGRRAREK